MGRDIWQSEQPSIVHKKFTVKEGVKLYESISQDERSNMSLHSENLKGF